MNSPSISGHGAPTEAELTAYMERARGGTEASEAAEAKSTTGAAAAKDTTGVGKSRGAAAAARLAEGLKLAPAGAPKIKLTDEHTKGATTLMNNLGPAMEQAMTSVKAASMGNKTTEQLSEMSADCMLAEYLKLEITDPNNSVETHQKLHTALSVLRKKGIKDAQVKAETAEAAKKEAQQYAETAGIIGTIVSVLMIALSVVLAAVTFGAASALVVVACVAAGALIGGIAAAASGGDVLDGALMGASIGGAVGSIGVGVAASMATAAAKTAAQVVVNEALKEATKEAIKNAVATAGKEATKEMVEQAVKEAVKEATKKAMTETVKKAAQEAAVKAATEAGKTLSKEAIQRAANEGVQQAVKSTITEAAKEVSKEAAKGVAKSAIVEGAKQGSKEVVAGMAKSAASETASQFGRQWATKVEGAAGLVGGSVQGGANLKASQMASDAQQLDVAGRRSSLRAEKMQEQIQEEAEIINMIIESKNKAVEAVIKMSQAAHGSNLKVQSAGMAK
jgi:hypothetical protein